MTMPVEPLPTLDTTKPVPEYARPHVPGGLADEAPSGAVRFAFVPPPTALPLAFEAEAKRNADAETIATLRASVADLQARNDLQFKMLQDMRRDGYPLGSVL